MLEALGFTFEVFPTDLDESPLPRERARPYAARLAQAKAAAAAARHPSSIVLAADTTVSLGRRILGKPDSVATASAMLRELSGRRHLVTTALVVRSARGALERTVATHVRLCRLSEAAIHWYVGTGEPMDKAGAYAIQGLGGAFVSRIQGSYSNVVGLPLAEALELLRFAGVRRPWERG